MPAKSKKEEEQIESKQTFKLGLPKKKKFDLIHFKLIHKNYRFNFMVIFVNY